MKLTRSGRGLLVLGLRPPRQVQSQILLLLTLGLTEKMVSSTFSVSSCFLVVLGVPLDDSSIPYRTTLNFLSLVDPVASAVVPEGLPSLGERTGLEAGNNRLLITGWILESASIR